MKEATTGAMQLAGPACGDFVATQRTHGATICYVITVIVVSVRARIAPVVAVIAGGDTFASGSEQHIKKTERFFTHSSHLRAGASNTLKKRNVFLHILSIYERERATHSQPQALSINRC